MLKPLLSHCLFVFAFMPALSQTRIISHVTNAEGGFSTAIVIENTSVVSQTLSLTPFSAAGEALDAVQFELEAQSVLRGDAHELLGSATSHFSIQAGNQVKVNTYYDFKDGNSSPAFVAESGEQGSRWRIFPGNWDQVFDGIAVVNTGSSATDVWISQKDNDNNVMTSRRIATDLAPNAKALYVIGSPNGSEFTGNASFFEVSGDQLLAVTALQGTLANETFNVLLASESRPMSRSSSKRDDKGIWFIEDGDLYDVFEMMGYNVTTDRLFQMEVFRRQARGTLGEIVSVNQISDIGEVDAFSRARAFSDAELDAFYADLDDETRIMMVAYIEGINRRIGQINATPELMPVEFTALGVGSLVAWTYRDMMAHIAAFELSFSMRAWGSEQVLNGALLQDLTEKYGAEQAATMFNDLRYTSDAQSQSMIAGADAKSGSDKSEQPLAYLRSDLGNISEGAYAYVDRVERIRKTLKDNGILIKGGSYAWVVDGSKTESGNPILYSGAQVGFTAPVLFVEGSIQSEAVSVSGMAIPGIPSMIVGRTPHHAGSMQVGYAGTWDY